MSWSCPTEASPHERITRGIIEKGGAPASYARVIEGLRDDAELRRVLTESLAALPYRGFKWETPAVTTATQGHSFEWVALDSPGLARRPDPMSFAEHFDAERWVARFRSLGRDAILVAPCPRAEESIYTHLASFLRGAPGEQVHALWQEVAVAMQHRLGERPVWLSTAGEEVAWLHVRLDDRPKYYGYAPFRVGPG